MRLSKEQQQIILDFYFRCGSDEDIAQGRDLIASNAEAARLYDGLEATLTELDSIKYEPCPDNLAELTVARLKIAALSHSTVHSNLQKLLDQRSESSVPVEPEAKIPVLLRKFYNIMAAAAAVVLMAGMAFPALNSLRAHSRQIACESNMLQVGEAFSKLVSDKDQFAEVKLAAGAPWWKVGDQSRQPQSNTRVAWQMIKQDYVKPEAFICAGHQGGISVTSQQLQSLQDFPSRSNISYSFMIICDKMGSMEGRSRRIVMGDMNPVFRQISNSSGHRTADLTEFEQVFLTDRLRKISSSNHVSRGQNVLFCDGSVQFIKDRNVNGDDIYTVRNVDTYSGTEMPCDENDVFLVP